MAEDRGHRDRAGGRIRATTDDNSTSRIGGQELGYFVTHRSGLQPQQSGGPKVVTRHSRTDH
jgi:hypothetical protein